MGFTDPANGPATCTNADGSYTIYGILLNEPISITAGYHGDCANLHGYATEWWDNSPTYLGAQLITLTSAEPNATDINFALQTGGRINGVITDAQTGQPIENMAVWVDFAWLGSCTNAQGQYSLERVMPNIDLYIKAGGPSNYCGGDATYDETTWGNPTPIMVTTGGIVPDIDFVLGDPPIVSVVLLTPEDGANLNDVTPTFTWNATDDAKRYRLEIDNEESFDTPIFAQNTSATSYTVPNALGAGQYFWRVQIELNTTRDWNGSSNIWSFTLDTTKPNKPVQTQPENGGTLPKQPIFGWTAITDAVSYTVQIDDKPDFATPLYDQQTSETSFTPPVTLDDGLWYWRVQARDNAQNKSGWTSVWSVRIDAVTAESPALLTPVDDFVTRSRTAIFTWQPVDGAKKYRLQVSDSSDFSAILVEKTLKPTTYTPLDLLPKGMIYWRVSALAQDGLWSAWSTVFSFEIDRTSPEAPMLLSPAHKAIISDTNTPTFDWEDSAEVDLAHYVIQIDNNRDFSSPLITLEVEASTYTTALELSNRGYFWRVRAVDEVGNRSPWSEQRKFTINQVLRFRMMQ